MKRYIRKIGQLMVCVATCGLTFTACSEDIDDANLYTFTGQNAMDFITSEEHADLSEFASIVKKGGLETMLSAYGTYTVFAPTNAAIDRYVDSLYNAAEDHNTLTAPTIDGFLNAGKADSLCQDFAKYHVAGMEVATIDMGSATVPKNTRTMLGKNVSTKLDSKSGNMMVNSSYIISDDNEVENGVVHILDAVLVATDRSVAEELKLDNDYTIFTEALEKTGLAEQLKTSERTTGINWFTGTSPESDYPYCEYPTECKVGFTIFAETDAVLKENGINSFEDLARKANEWYQNCTEWYDYAKRQVNGGSITISTGTDYTNQWNTLNMYMRYHILPYAVEPSRLVFSFNEKNNYVYEYNRTLLPHTMSKVTRDKRYGERLWLNRYVNNASLSETPASSYDYEFHGDSERELESNKEMQGIEIDTKNSKSAGNGYIHPIKGMLIYDAHVPQKVLKERIRVDFVALLDEMMSNSFRGAECDELASIFGRNEKRYAVRYPSGYFENMKVYAEEETRVMYLTRDECKLTGSSYACWNDYQGDELFCKGAYDFAIKLPPVPQDGTYELRFGYVNNGLRTIVQFYLSEGTSDRSNMIACDIPLNQNVSMTSSAVGWTDPTKESDGGAATEKAMRNRGYMRGPDYFSNYLNGANKTARYRTGSGQEHIRRIVVRQHFNQGEYWFRMKTALPENTEAEFELDYIELVPSEVYNNAQYSEDIY